MAAEKGRGATDNLEGRFAREARSGEDDGWGILDEPLPPLATTVQAEAARSIISRNDSPDIPFTQSINPYRGCEHGCSYCVWEDTLILCADGQHRQIKNLRVGDRIMGTRREGGQHRLAETEVLAHWQTQKMAIRLILGDGTELVASGDHRFLAEKGWKYVQPADDGDQRPALTLNTKLIGINESADLTIKSIAALGKALPMYDITTGTGDFIANGVISHNCYARPSHAYMDLSPGLDFETKLFYKQNAAALLRDEFRKPRYRVSPITLGANTDPYQPIEREYRVTRSLLEVMLEFRHPCTIITKSSLVLRDLELLRELAADGLVQVMVSITSLDPAIKRTLEPRAAGPQARLRAVRELSAAGVPTGVMVAPIIPAVTDHEIERLVAAAAEAGAASAGYVLLRLPFEVKDVFRGWLDEHYPQRAAHVMSLVQQMRGGRDNDPRFGHRMRGEGEFATLISQRFKAACRKHGVNKRDAGALRTDLFRPPPQAGDQIGLFG